MKTKNFYIATASGVLDGVQVCFNEVNVLCLGDTNGVRFDTTVKQSKFIKAIKKVFLLRGLFLFFYNLLIFFKNYNISFKNYNKRLLKFDYEYRKSKKKELFLFRFFLVLSVFICFIFLPIILYPVGKKLFSPILFEIVKILLKFTLVTLLILGFGKLKITKNIFQNTGAINKVINSFKKENMLIDYRKINSNKNIYVFDFSTSFVSTFFLIYCIVPLISLGSTVFTLLIKILFTILIICLAYEIQLVVQYNCKNQNIIYILGGLFLYFSGLLSLKPTNTQLMLSKIAMEEIIQMNFDEVYNIPKKPIEIPFSKVLSEVKTKLIENGIDDPIEAKYLICETLGIKQTDMVLLRSITKVQEKKIKKVLNERIKRKPLCKILGYKYFYGLKFNVNNNVLSPRQETEILVEQVVDEVKKSGKKLKILDMCTGSGAIAISVKKNANCEMFAVDKSKLALNVAMKNANELDAKVQFFQGDMFKHLKDANKFDIIACNPPYIESKEIENLDKEVKNFDPLMSLDGGSDGLKFYRILADTAHKFLNKNGKIFLEIGFDQADNVSRLLEENFKDIIITFDFAGLPRVISAVRK